MNAPRGTADLPNHLLQMDSVFRKIVGATRSPKWLVDILKPARMGGEENLGTNRWLVGSSIATRGAETKGEA